MCCTHFYETILWWSAQILICDEKHAEYFSSLSELSGKSPTSQLYTVRGHVCAMCVCAHGNNSPVLAEATGHSTERSTVCVVSVSGVASNTQNTMWVFYVDVGWGVEVQVWFNCSPAGRRGKLRENWGWRVWGLYFYASRVINHWAKWPWALGFSPSKSCLYWMKRLSSLLGARH